MGEGGVKQIIKNCLTSFMDDPLMMMNLLTLLGEVFAFIGTVEKFSIEKLDSDDSKNELKRKKKLIINKYKQI